MLVGTIKEWNQLKGWGFIEDDDGYDYFVNISNVKKGFNFKAGIKVKFDVFHGQRGDEAENVRPF